jgi:Uma2 family endonuclease
MTSLPDWMRPPRSEGWLAEDLDRLPEAPRHTELIDGALVFMMSPQRRWHARVIISLTTALTAQAPEGVFVDQEMTVRLDDRNRPEPDVVVTTVPVDRDQTWFDASDVLLVVELVSPESEHRDRTVKLRKYAAAGIKHYWLLEEDDDRTVAHVYELDEPTMSYVPTGIIRGKLELSVPFPVTIDLDGLFPTKR